MRRRSGFTLIELLIVIAIIGILIASIAVAVTKAKELANNLDMKNNMKELTTACLTADGDHRKLPPAWGAYGRPRPGTTTKVTSGVFFHMLPYLQQKAMFDLTTGHTYIPVYASKLDPTFPASPGTHTSYVANIRVFSTFAAGKQEFESVAMASANTLTHFSIETIPDGNGSTIFFATKYAVCSNGTANTANSYTGAPSHTNGPYFGAGSYDNNSLVPKEAIPIGTGTTGTSAGAGAAPPYQVSPSLSGTATNACNNDQGMYGHSFAGQGMCVAMGDRSVRNLSFTVTGQTFARLITPGDGKPAGADW